jgi:probable FeS assembly SUF system protein SufT
MNTGIMLNQEVTLTRDCPATLIPAGDAVTLPAGSRVFVSQALGGTVTVRADSGLFRIAGQDLDALGEGAEEQLRQESAPRAAASAEFREEMLWEALRSCYDPEIPINIVDLGLIYDLQCRETPDGRRTVAVRMTLTAQGCGMGPVIADDARGKLEALPQVESASVEIVWDPVWTPQMISEEGRKKLGIA